MVGAGAAAEEAGGESEAEGTEGDAEVAWPETRERKSARQKTRAACMCMIVCAVVRA